MEFIADSSFFENYRILRFFEEVFVDYWWLFFPLLIFTIYRGYKSKTYVDSRTRIICGIISLIIVPPLIYYFFLR